MADIEHWIARRTTPDAYDRTIVVWDEVSVEGLRRNGWTVEGPFVPAEQLRGAVASLAVIRGALDDLEHAPHRAQALADLPDIIRAALGGQ